MKNPQEYYDQFSEGYDRRRDKGYHAFLDEMESETVRRHITSGRLLDAGCGTGLGSMRLQAAVPILIGVDLSIGMLRQAAARGQTIVQAELGALPFQDGTFDGIFSFKVLAHVPGVRQALEELKRVVKPNGVMVLEFYNPISLRGLKKRFHIRHRVAPDADETQVFTTFHTLTDITRILPEGLAVTSVRGIMIFTPLAVLHRIAVIGSLLRFLERKFCDGPLNRFGGFLDVAVEKHDRQS
jgi:ubiquinone/menaquinone biosynthesis C-methylase UbiE